MLFLLVLLTKITIYSTVNNSGAVSFWSQSNSLSQQVRAKHRAVYSPSQANSQGVRAVPV